MKKHNPNVLIAVVGDLMGSRRIKDRRRGARKIEAAVSKVAAAFDTEFIAPLKLTRGIDEFSAVLRTPTKSFRLCRWLNDAVHPLQFRIVVVSGRIDVHRESGDAARMDGPAFHRAAEILAEARRLGQTYRFALSDQSPQDRPSTREAALSEGLTILANLARVIEIDRTDTQREICRLYDSLGKQALVARKKEISQPAVSDILAQAHYKPVRDAHAHIDNVLASWPDVGG